MRFCQRFHFGHHFEPSSRNLDNRTVYDDTVDHQILLAMYDVNSFQKGRDLKAAYVTIPIAELVPSHPRASLRLTKLQYTTTGAIMEPGMAAAAYASETAAEGVIGAGFAIAKSTMPLKATWKRIPTNKPLPRSSHSLSIIKGKAYIFGGEEQPREPVSNDMHVYTLPSSGVLDADYKRIPAQAKTDGDAPPPRVGHTANAIGDKIYIFGGRGGKAMQPWEENGRVWVFDTRLNSWNFLDPPKGSPYPPARSYHASAAIAHPQSSMQDHTEDQLESSDSEVYGTIFIHGGCPTAGRVADVWAFDLTACLWSRLPDAPGPARGGPSLTLTQNRLYRFGGFNGEIELGGLDYLDLSTSTFNDKGGKGELAVIPLTGKWESVRTLAEAKIPGNRSVAGLQPITTGQGRNYLLLFLGEGDPSSLGHAGAGKFYDDVWCYQLRPDGMTAASFKDATRQLVGAKTGEGSWTRVEIPEASMTQGEHEHPGPRGWFASTNGNDLDRASVILWGGLTSNNTRADDGWILTVQV